MTEKEVKVYDAPTKIQEIEVLNTYQLEERAGEIVPKGGFDYISGGSGDEFTLRRNTTSWDTKGILPRVLADVEYPDPSLHLGHDIPAPLWLLLLLWVNTKQKKLNRKGVADFGIIMSISAYSGAKFEEIEAGLNEVHAGSKFT